MAGPNDKKVVDPYGRPVKDNRISAAVPSDSPKTSAESKGKNPLPIGQLLPNHKTPSYMPRDTQRSLGIECTTTAQPTRAQLKKKKPKS
jgi:hypothetical protein